MIDNIMKNIHSLKFGELSKRVDSLVAMNDIISNFKEYQKAMIKCANELCSAITYVMVDTFEKPEPALRFTKYFVTIVSRVCSLPDVMQACS